MPRLAARWFLSDRTSADLRASAFEAAIDAGASVELADDIAQVTLLRLVEAADRNPGLHFELIGPGRSVYAERWARRTLAEHREAEDRRRREEERAADETASVPAGVGLIEELEGVLFIQGLVRSFEHQEQLFVYLRYFEGLTVADIADILGIDQGGARAVGLAANAKLRSVLQEGGVGATEEVAVST